MSEETYILNWYSAGHDYTAKFQDTVFRIHRDYKTHKMRGSDPQEYIIYKLQIRKEKNIEYRDLGYEFYIPKILDYYELGKQYSVKEKFWADEDDIIDEVEKILLSNFYIEASEQSDNSEDQSEVNVPVEAYRVAAMTIIKALQKKNIISPEIDEVSQHTLDNILLWALQHFRKHSFDILVDESGEINPIRLREYEIDLRTCLTNPDLYFGGNWREVFYGQVELHDDEWLADSLEEEVEEERRDAEERIFYDPNWSEEKIALRIQRGYGQGEKESYQPWLTTSDVSKDFNEVTSMKPGSWICNRKYYLLGELEMAYFNVLNWDFEIIDIRESFPLEREITLRLAKELKIKHPRDEKSNAPLVLTTSFLVTRSKAGVNEMQAVTVVWKDKIKKKQIDHIKLLDAYWGEKGIQHKTVTENEVNGILYRNMNLFFEWKYAHRYVITETNCIHTIDQLKSFRQHSLSLTIDDFIRQAATDAIDAPSVRGAILFLIANRVIDFPMEEIEYKETLQIKMLNPVDRRFRVNDVSYPDKFFEFHVLNILD